MDNNPLRKARVERGLTQGDVAALFDVETMTVYRWEAGTSFPRRRYWPEIERFTGKPIAAMIAAAKPVAAE